MGLSSTPSVTPEDSKQIERQDVLQSVHEERVNFAQEIETMQELCGIIQGTDQADIHLLPRVEAALTTYGVSAEEALADKELLQIMKGEFSALKNKKIDVKARNEAQLISSRMLELKDQTDLQSLLTQIREEFGEQVDEETSAVLANYEALFDPQFITDEGERQAVETLFWQQANVEFSQTQFSSFIDTIEKQPDTVISQATKQKIRERFTPKKSTPKTGAQIIKAMKQKDEEGNPVYHSPETAVKQDSGVMAYTNENGKTVFIYPDLDDNLSYSAHEAPATQSGELYGQHINTNIVRNLIAEEFNSLQGLLGGETTMGVLQDHYDGDTLKNTQRFITCLIGSQESGAILVTNQISTISTYLKAFSNPLNSNKSEDLQDMTELGIYQDGTINWKRMAQAGTILREHKGFKLQGMQDETAPYRLLKQELKRKED
jgi:hypothetical protein